jgi:AcrR family transcriptional regulator
MPHSLHRRGKFLHQPRHDERMTDSAGSRTRRSSAEVRSLVVRAARELFEERGYEQVSTRDIAARAGVTQALVFRHFATKADLFVDVAYLPFSEFLGEYMDGWATRGQDRDTSARDTEVFVGGLYRILLKNRKLLVTLNSESVAESPHVPTHMATLLQDLLGRLEAAVGREATERGTETIDPRYAVRFAFALVYGTVLLGDALFPEVADDVAAGSISNAMAGFVLRGSQLPPG